VGSRFRQDLAWRVSHLPSVVTALFGLLGAFVAGAAVIVFGVWLYRRPAECDGNEMNQGDTCVSEQGGEEISRETYDEVLGGHHDVGFFVVAVGCLIIFGGIAAVVVALRQALMSWRSGRGVATITPRPMTVVLLGAAAMVAGGVAAALNVGPLLDPVVCEREPMEHGDYCEATSKDYTDQEMDQKIRPGILTFGGGAVAIVGVAAGALGVRARSRGNW